MNGNGELYILYVIILAVVGIATLVRKAIEKASSGEKGKKVNLAQVVQRELRKYMGVPEAPPAGTPGRPDPNALESDRPPPRPRFTAPPPAVEKTSPPREERTVPTLVDARGAALSLISHTPSALARPGLRRADLRLDRTGLRRAILLAEVLGPPVGERRDYRLF